MDKSYSIKEAAKILNVNAQTLRRWDKSGRLSARKVAAGKIKYFCYTANALEEFLSNDWRAFLKLAKRWSMNAAPPDLPGRFYCADKAIFKARLSRFEFDLKSIPELEQTFPLLVAIVGEIGNNSFDHNLGNWPDINGILFGYNLSEKKIILADRGQGVLTTLRQIKPELSDHQAAVRVAFTEIISGRAPESRGNGLKFVREVIAGNNFKLRFQSGDAVLKLKKNDRLPTIQPNANFLPGCQALLEF